MAESTLLATVVVADLFQALRRVKRSAAPLPGFLDSTRARRRAPIPILTHVKIEVVEDVLSLTCTNLRVADIARLHTWNSNDGTFCVPVRVFTDITSRLRDVGEPMMLAVRPAKIAAWGSDDDYAQDRDLPSVLSIVCGTAQFRLIGLPVADFPLIQSIPRPSAGDVRQEENGTKV